MDHLNRISPESFCSSLNGVTPVLQVKRVEKIRHEENALKGNGPLLYGDTSAHRITT